MNELISVVVPIYNVAEYLPKSIESILNQTHKNLEILLIDDGSTDGCAQICDEYAAKDSRIKVIHKENGGVTSARKVGIAMASGAYIGSVDPDDWIESDMYESLLKKAVEYDVQIVFSDMWRHTFSGNTLLWSKSTYLDEGCYDFDVVDRRIVLDYFFNTKSDRKVNGGLHIKLFESALMKKWAALLYDQIKGFDEDRILVFASLTECRKIYIYHKAFYHGVDRHGSYCHSVNPFFFQEEQYMYLYLKEVFESSPYSEILLKQMYKYLLHRCQTELERLAGRSILPAYLIRDTEDLKGKRVVLYGAGRVGKAVRQQLVSQNVCDVILWVDREYDLGRRIYPAADINKYEYDCILVAVKGVEMYEEIEKELRTMGCSGSSIIWKKTVGLADYFDTEDDTFARGGGKAL